MSERIVLSVDRCDKHRDFFAVCLSVGSSGRRLTPSKCCGRWHAVMRWTLQPDQAREIAAELLAAAEPEQPE